MVASRMTEYPYAECLLTSIVQNAELYVLDVRILDRVIVNDWRQYSALHVDHRMFVYACTCLHMYSNRRRHPQCHLIHLRDIVSVPDSHNNNSTRIDNDHPHHIQASSHHGTVA